MNLTVSNEINGYTITERMQNRPSCNFKIKRMLHFSVAVTTNLTSERSDFPLEITIEQFFAFNISGIRPGYRDLFLVPGKSLTNFSYVSVIAPLKTNWILNQITFYNDQGEIIQSFSHGEKITHQIFIHPQYETMQLLVQVETGETGNEDDIILRLYCTDGIIEDMLGSPIDNFQPNATDNITITVEGERQNHRMFIIGPVSEHYIYINRCDSNLDKEKLITECSRNKLCNLTAFGLQIHFAILMSISGEGIRHVNLIRKSGSLTQMLTYSSLQPTSVVKEVFCPNDDGIKNLQRMLVKCETRCAEAKLAPCRLKKRSLSQKDI
ncbi:Hypothetical predicted protein [Octopus vulgaris]|uniref:Uncharacterized protein n=1 Tax=Octopus vulgaris TaxID=6645 RepID=A0AA36FC88_OCTVU|nr:Hypothetical predicted protein [Octopus vulgaris]